MTPNDFIYWISGYLSAIDEENYTPPQFVSRIKDALKDVRVGQTVSFNPHDIMRLQTESLEDRN